MAAAYFAKECGWSMKPRMSSDLAIDAMLMAVWRRTPNKKDKDNPLYNDSMNGAEVKFDSAGRPFTAFPTK